MKQVSETTDRKTRILDGIAQFLTRFRKPIIAVLIVLVVLTVSLVVFLSVQSSRAERALESVETLTNTYRDWIATVETNDGETVSSEFGQIESRAADLIEQYDGTYAAVRARMIVAEGHFELENWQQAATAFTEVASQTTGTYLSAVALMAAGVSLENAGDPEGALERYTRITEADGSGYGFLPRALFSVGRIQEIRGEIVAASEAYQSLIDDYPTSSWTNLARNRIITLTVQGRIGE